MTVLTIIRVSQVLQIERARGRASAHTLPWCRIRGQGSFFPVQAAIGDLILDLLYIVHAWPTTAAPCRLHVAPRISDTASPRGSELDGIDTFTPAWGRH